MSYFIVINQRKQAHHQLRSMCEFYIPLPYSNFLMALLEKKVFAVIFSAGENENIVYHTKRMHDAVIQVQVIKPFIDCAGDDA